MSQTKTTINHAIRCIIGLGNPGKRYENTRHNAGAWFIHALAAQLGEKLQPSVKHHGLITTCQIEESPCYLLIPSGYMNHSGKTASAIATYYRLKPQEILIVHDELDFPAGTIRLKQGGGHGGHNGLRDIISALGSGDFLRLRLGINHPGHRDAVSDYVLSCPSRSDKQKIETAIDQGIATLPDLIKGNIEQAMQWLHTDVD